MTSSSFFFQSSPSMCLAFYCKNTMSFSEVYGTGLALFVETYQEKELLEEVDDLPKDLQTVSISSHLLFLLLKCDGSGYNLLY